MSPRLVLTGLIVGGLIAVSVAVPVAGLTADPSPAPEPHSDTTDQIEHVGSTDPANNPPHARISTIQAGTASFTSGGYQITEGDRGRFTVSITDIDNATITIGSAQVGYQAGITVDDGNNDGKVTVVFDTAEAGNGETQETFSTVDTADTIRVANPETITPDDQLDTGVYGLTATTPDGRQTGLSGVALTRRSTQSVSVHSIPSGASPSTVEEVKSVSSNTSSVAIGDEFAILIEASGFGGTLRDATADDLEPGSSTPQTEGVALEVTQINSSSATQAQTNSQSNQGPQEFEIAEMSLVTNTSAGSYALIGDTDDFPGTAANDEFNITLDVTEESPYVQTLAEAAEQSGSSTLRFVPNSVRLSDFDSADNAVIVPTQSQYALTGTTTAAPGTTFAITVQADDSSVPYFTTQEASVTPRQTFSTTLNTSRLEVGDSLSIEIEDDALTDSLDAYDTRAGVVGPPRYDLSVDVTASNGSQIPNPTYTIDGQTSESLPDLVSGTYDLTVSAPGYVPRRTPVSINGSDRTLEVTLIPRSSAYTLTVTVVDETGDPLPNATVIAGEQQHDASELFQLTAGEYTVNASADGYEPLTQEVTVSDNRSLTVNLTATQPGSEAPNASEQSPNSSADPDSGPNSSASDSSTESSPTLGAQLQALLPAVPSIIPAPSLLLISITVVLLIGRLYT